MPNISKSMFSLFKKQINPDGAAKNITVHDIGETEQRAPKAGYFILAIMFVVALLFGWRALDDLQDVPPKPELLSSCAASFIGYDWEDYGRYPIRTNIYAPAEPYDFSYPPKPDKTECIFSSYEVTHGIPALFENRKGKDLELSNLQLELQKTNATIQDLERRYNLGLQEKIAEEQRKLYPIEDIQRQLEPLRQKRADLENTLNAFQAELKPLDDALKNAYKPVLQDYRKAWRWYEFKVFLLELLLVAPFFWFVFQMYQKLLYRKSPYTIIWTALLGVAAILLARIFIVWFWDLFLARILQTIWDYVQNFALLKSLVFYGGMILSITVFGGAVYLLQKHIFDPKRAMLRSLKNKKCPTCGVSLDLSEEFCPQCGTAIREKCLVCGQKRFVGFLHCPHCGAKK